MGGGGLCRKSNSLKEGIISLIVCIILYKIIIPNRVAELRFAVEKIFIVLSLVDPFLRIVTEQNRSVIIMFG